MFETNKPLMSREEWFNSPEFTMLRLLNNKIAGIGHSIRDICDLLNFILSFNKELNMSELNESMTKINYESAKLWENFIKIDKQLQPEFNDINYPKV